MASSADTVLSGNLYGNVLGVTGDEEAFESLVRDGDVHIERIVSYGTTSDWFDQDTVEFVTLLRGSATLQVEGESGERVLRPGDYLSLPKHKRHRVTGTSTDGPTIWLAFHWK